MDNVFRDMQFVYVYLDNILVASSSVEEHCIHLRQLFERLAEYGLVVNPQKCVLGQSSLDFLGHRVTSDGIHPLQDRVQAIRDYPQPRTAKSLKEYLGLLNFYRRFVPHAAAILLPLYELVSLKDTEFCAAWTSLHEKHFQQSKDALAAATCLAHPSPTAETCINTDASDTAVGAVLQQHIAGVWTPICFFSRKLHSAETKGVIDLTLPPLPEDEYPLPVRSICLNLFRNTLYVFHPSSRKTVEVCVQLTIQNGSHKKHDTDMQRLCCNIIRNLNLVHIIRTYTEHYHYAQTK